MPSRYERNVMFNRRMKLPFVVISQTFLSKFAHP